MAQADTGARDRGDRAKRGQRPGAGVPGGPLIDDTPRPGDSASLASSVGVGHAAEIRAAAEAGAAAEASAAVGASTAGKDRARSSDPAGTGDGTGSGDPAGAGDRTGSEDPAGTGDRIGSGDRTGSGGAAGTGGRAGSESQAAGPTGPGLETTAAGDSGAGGRGARERHSLPPGQYVPRTLPVLHYGPIPAFHRETWDLRIFGATESGAEVVLRWDDLAAMPVSQVTADFHCVTKFTVPGVHWGGVLAAEVLRRFPPAAAVTHVMIWADFGYSANIRISDFVADETMLATHRDGERLTPEHGYPLRLVVPHLYAWKSVKWIRAFEYLTTDRRGFWEERGYHNTADPWREQRYSYQELDGEGPPL